LKQQNTRIAGIFQNSFTNCKERQAIFNCCAAHIPAFWSPYLSDLINTDTQTQQNFVFSAFSYLLQTSQREFHHVLLRRFSCVAIFIFSCISGTYYDEWILAKSFHDARLHLEYSKEDLSKEMRYFRDAGRRYSDIALRLGGMGIIWWLPLEATPSVYAFFPRLPLHTNILIVGRNFSQGVVRNLTEH
jgi:hypothetical protein